MLDIERGCAQGILPAAWQTDTCIGDWHYKRSIFAQHQYKTAETVAQMLVDIVSKNGNLMLNIPPRGDGSIDEDEHAFLQEFAAWMKVHGEGIYGTRPFAVFGEGAPDVTSSAAFNESAARKLNASDIRFTQSSEALYVWVMGWPEDGRLRVKTLAGGSQVFPGKVSAVEMLGRGRIGFEQTGDGLVLALPVRPSGHLNAFGFRVMRT